MHEILAKFDADCFVTREPIPGSTKMSLDGVGGGVNGTDFQSILVLRIEAGLFLPNKSKFKVKFDARDIGGFGSGDDINITPSKLELGIRDRETVVIQNEGSRPVFVRKWNLADPDVSIRASNGRYEYDIEARLIFSEDGETKYPSEKPLFKNGKCKFLSIVEAKIRG